MRAARSSAAAWIAERMRGSLASGAAAGPASVDAWNQYPMLNNLVFAHRAASEPSHGRAEAREPDPDRRFTHLPEAGLLCVRTSAYEAVLATGKGGVVKVWDRASGRLAYTDSGWVGRAGKGLVATQSVASASKVTVEKEGVEIEGRAVRVSRPTFSPVTFLGFRAFTLTIGRLHAVALRLKQLLVHVLVRRRAPVDLRFQRRVAFGEREVVVADRLWGSAPVAALVRAARFATIHMGSSRYFTANELRGARDEDGAADRIDPRELRAGASRERRVSFPWPGGAASER
jgi:hypothetical protein